MEVDEDTGKVKVLKVVAIHDAGRILNPSGAEGQIEGGVVMSLGYALMEQLLLDEGVVVNPSFADYKLVTSLEVPEIEVEFVGSPDPAGPVWGKGAWGTWLHSYRSRDCECHSRRRGSPPL